MAGHTTSYGEGEWDNYLLKTDGEGRLLWQMSRGTKERLEEASSIQETPDGGAIVVGALDGQVYLAKLEPDGIRPTPTPFRRGDYNVDGGLDLADPISSLEGLFLGLGEPACASAADANGDDVLDLSDPVGTLVFLFSGGMSLPDPGPQLCGPAPNLSALGCRSYSACSR